MKISVVIPCFNAAPWIAQALKSAATQSLPPHEILVVDDGSTDDSLEAIRACGVPVRLLHTRRANGAGARNEGIRHATGDWIAFLDADDVWYPEHLERAAELLGRGNDVAYLGHYDHLDLEGRLLPLPPFWPVGRPETGLTDREFLRLFSLHQFFGMASVVVRRERLVEVGCLDATQLRRHDLEMWLRVIQGATWSFDPRACYGYRADTPGSVSKARPDAERWFLLALTKNRARLDGPELRSLLRLGARRSMSSAFRSGDLEELKQAVAVASPWLSPADRLVFAAGMLNPKLFNRFNEARRRWTGPLGTP